MRPLLEVIRQKSVASKFGSRIVCLQYCGIV